MIAWIKARCGERISDEFGWEAKDDEVEWCVMVKFEVASREAKKNGKPVPTGAVAENGDIGIFSPEKLWFDIIFFVRMSKKAVSLGREKRR